MKISKDIKVALLVLLVSILAGIAMAIKFAQLMGWGANNMAGP